VGKYGSGGSKGLVGIPKQDASAIAKFILHISQHAGMSSGPKIGGTPGGKYTSG